MATVGGSLKDEFEIPGSDTQKATDLIESEFAEEQGGVLNLVFAAPAGERLDTPERKAAVEAAITSLALREGVIPPTINYETPDPECDLDFVPNKARKKNIKAALSLSLGFGGINAALLFKKYAPS